MNSPDVPKKSPGKKSLHEKLSARKIRRPPLLPYLGLGYLWKALFEKKLNVHYEYRIDLKDYRKGPYIVVSNHASRLDYIYTGCAFLPHRLNYVAGYNEFFRSHLASVFRLLQVIPKKNFTPDLYAIKSMHRVLDRGGKVIVFPEGMSSIGGGNQPCALGSGKMLKHFGVPVLAVRISGGYLTNTKYCLDERRGKVEVVVDKLFSPEELARMGEEEIEDRLHAAIRNDDYAWNKAARVKFDGHGRMAHNLHHLLYWCPRCGAEFSMKGEGDVIRCGACGNGARINEYYDFVPLDESCVIPATSKAWFDLERAKERAALREDGYALCDRVKLGTLPADRYLEDQRTSAPAGEGLLRLDRDGLRYEGTRDGLPCRIHIPAAVLPTYGMCTDVTFFYTFHRNEYLEFTPERESTGKWLLATEENHRLAGGAWRDFKDAESSPAAAKA